MNISFVFLMWTIAISAFSLVAVKTQQTVSFIFFPTCALQFTQEMFCAHGFAFLSTATLQMFNGQKFKRSLSTALTFTAIDFDKFPPKLPPILSPALLAAFRLCITFTILKPLLALFGCQVLMILSQINPIFFTLLISPSSSIFFITMVAIVLATCITINPSARFAERIVKMLSISTQFTEFGKRFQYFANRAFSLSINDVYRSWHVVIPLHIQLHNIIPNKIERRFYVI